MNTSTMTAAFAAALLCGGCVLPIPSRTTLREGLSGRVVDAGSAKPVSGAEISARFAVHHHRDNRPITVTSDASGRFRIPGLYQYHWGYLIGIALNYPLPYRAPFGPTSASSVAIRHPSYQPFEYSFPVDHQVTALLGSGYSKPLPEQNKIYRLAPKK